jgi:hypothetical protein
MFYDAMQMQDIEYLQLSIALVGSIISSADTYLAQVFSIFFFQDRVSHVLY